MTNQHERSSKHAVLPADNKKTDVLFYVASVAAVVVALVLVPKILGATGLSFIAPGSGLSKLFSVVAAVAAGWGLLLPTSGYRNFLDLAKGARNEWRKTIKPDRETVTRTTLMVLALVAMFALLILLLDWLFGSILRAIVL